jgi:hypothetical protein
VDHERGVELVQEGGAAGEHGLKCPTNRRA